MNGDVVLLHGLGGSPAIWARVIALLGDSTTVFAPSLHGSSSIEDDALDVARQMRAHGLSSATVVGHSRGGLVATALAEQFPSMVERMVLVSTPPTTASRRTARGASQRLLRIPVLGPIIWALLPATALERGLETAFAPRPSVPAFAVDDLAQTGRARLVADGDAIDLYLEAGDLPARLSSVGCPVDVVYGLDDRRVEPAAMELSTRGGNIRAHALAHEGHGPPWASAGAVTAVIRGSADTRDTATPTPPHRPTLSPIRWTPPKAPSRARATSSSVAVGDIRRIELPGRGPEDVRVDSRGRILTGVEDGRILRVTLHDGAPVIETIADTGGRPLGIAVVDDSALLVCDSERGLLRIDVDSGDVRTLVSDVEGVPLNFASNVVTTRSGRVYFTASTRRFAFEDYLADLLEHSGTGRLLVLEPDGSVRTLVDGIQFANGLAVSDDETLFTVSETGSFRLARYSARGDQIVPADPLIDNLPGFPDNISVDGDLVWISLPSARVPLFDVAARLPGVVRKLAYALPESVRAGTATTWVMAVNQQGDVVCDLQSSTPDYSSVTSVIRTDRHLVLGSITESALAVVELPDAYAALAQPGTTL